MDHKEEYHDPDYPGVSVCIKEEPSSLTEDEKSEKIKEIIRREFSNELEIRENEIMLIDQRMSTSRRLLHRLRYTIVNSYYKDQKLQLSNSQVQDDIAAQHEPRARAQISSLLRDGQRRLHPSVRKLLGKQTVDLEEIFRSRAPRNKIRKDYSAMLQKNNYTISADTTKSLRPDKKPEDIPPEDPSTSKPKKIPRHLDPKVSNVVTLDEVTRNKMKHRYRIVIGNTSKYAPPASRADRSTHKWLLYIRGPPHAPDLSPLLTAVTVRLHHSYAPHHTVHIDKPPYHITRRGWGEFPAKIELHFVLSEMNRPATVEHTIKLDRNYTGMQMLGAETLVNVWLYSTQDMLKYEFKEDTEAETQTDVQADIEPKQEPPEVDNTNEIEENDNGDNQTDNWLDFFTKEPTELDVDEMIIKPVKKTEEKNDIEAMIERNVIEKSAINMDTEEFTIKTEQEWNDTEYKAEETPSDIPNEILNQPSSNKKRIVKYIDPTTGKIYYLEMDRALDLSKVQEIVINNTKTAKISPIKSNGLKNTKKKKGISLLKPEIKNLLKNENNLVKQEKPKLDYSHIENDHCYLASPWSKGKIEKPVEENCISESVVKKEKTLYNCLCSVVCRFNCVRAAVNYMVKRIPLVTDQARDPDFVKNFPFVVENEEKFWKLDFAKRRNIEWSRAKIINRILKEHFSHTEQIWRTKQILLFSRLHGYYPIRTETIHKQTEEDEWSSWNDLENIRKLESNIKEMYPNATDISSLSIFNCQADSLPESIDLTDEEDVDIVGDNQTMVKKEVMSEVGGLTVVPVENEQDRMMFMYLERKCADIGIELRNENVGNGLSYSAVHAVMLSAIKSFAEEVIRSALAAKLSTERAAEPLPSVWTGSSTSRSVITLEHVYRAISNPRLHALSSRDIATERKNSHAI